MADAQPRFGGPSVEPEHDTASHADRLEVERALDAELIRALGRIAALSRDHDDIVERSFDASRDDEHDPEGATIAFERAQVSALLAAARRQQAEIGLAQERLRRGTLGICEGCGAPIPRERLLARPTARTCVHCAS